MGFSDAVRSGFDHYVKFDGRASRAAYWWWFLFALLAWIVAYILDIAVDATIFQLIVALGLFLPGLSVAIRRLHDTDRSGWWILIGLIPLIGAIVLIVFYLQKSDPAQNRFGPPPGPEGVSAPTGMPA